MADETHDNLIRMTAHDVEVRDDGGDGRTLVGYAARFNAPTVINNYEGNFREVIAPGAFARTLKNNGGQIKVLFNHGMDPSIGDKPLGRASVVQEDDKGLYVEVPLSRTSYNEDIIALLSDGAIDGMSFRFSVPKNGDSWEHPKSGLPTRTLNEVRLMEFGPVTFPAYQATSAGVRSREEFSVWDNLPEEKRAAIRQIITGTSDETPADGTVSDEPARSTTDGPGADKGPATTPGVPPKRSVVMALAGLDDDWLFFSEQIHQRNQQDDQ